MESEEEEEEEEEVRVCAGIQTNSYPSRSRSSNRSRPSVCLSGPEVGSEILENQNRFHCYVARDKKKKQLKTHTH